MAVRRERRVSQDVAFVQVLLSMNIVDIQGEHGLNFRNGNMFLILERDSPCLSSFNKKFSKIAQGMSSLVTSVRRFNRSSIRCLYT